MPTRMPIYEIRSNETNEVLCYCASYRIARKMVAIDYTGQDVAITWTDDDGDPTDGE